MAGDTSAEAKRRWLQQLISAPPVPAAAAAGESDTDLDDPELKQAKEELDRASEEVVQKDEAELDAEQKLAKARADRAAAATTFEKADASYKAAEAKAHAGRHGADGDLPAPMLPDCVPQPDRIAGPKEHVLCKTHGHVLDLKAKTIIAHTVAEYDALYPVPRPMEADCKVERGLIPAAPDNIVMCATHGHVLDTAKKQIIANSGIVFLRAHPEYVTKPKPKVDAKPATPPAPAAPQGAKPATPQAPAAQQSTPATPQPPPAPTAPNSTPAQPAGPQKDESGKVGKWTDTLGGWKDLEGIAVVAEADWDRLSFALGWSYSREPTLVPPPLVHAELKFFTQDESYAEIRKGPEQLVTLPYDFSGTFSLRDWVISPSFPVIFFNLRIVLVGVGADTLEKLGGMIKLPIIPPTA